MNHSCMIVEIWVVALEDRCSRFTFRANNCQVSLKGDFQAAGLVERAVEDDGCVVERRMSRERRLGPKAVSVSVDPDSDMSVDPAVPESMDPAMLEFVDLFVS